jgi:hypothetical protein
MTPTPININDPLPRLLSAGSEQLASISAAYAERSAQAELYRQLAVQLAAERDALQARLDALTADDDGPAPTE